MHANTNTGRTATTKVMGYRHTDSNTCTAGIVLPTKATRCAVLKPNGGLPGVKDVAFRPMSRALARRKHPPINALSRAGAPPAPRGLSLA